MADTIFSNKYERREFDSTKFSSAQDIVGTDSLVIPASQTIPDATDEQVVLPTGTLPSGFGNVDAQGIVFIAVKGVYHFDSHVSWNMTGATNGNRGSYWVIRNVATKKLGYTKCTAAGGGLGFNGVVSNSSFTMLLEAGDSAELYCYHSQGGPVDIYGSDTGGVDHTTVLINKIG